MDASIAGKCSSFPTVASQTSDDVKIHFKIRLLTRKKNNKKKEGKKIEKKRTSHFETPPQIFRNYGKENIV